MTAIDFFYQGEGLVGIEHIAVDSDATVATVKQILTAKHGFSVDMLLFVENADDPLGEAVELRAHATPAGIKAHVHRCRLISVSVRFNQETVERDFAPSTTIAHVKHWAAVHKFKMTDEEAEEHALQIAGSHDRPHPGTHLGALSKCPDCHLSFDLVPDERINGASGLA